MSTFACRYLVLPVLLVACQYVSTAIITPKKDPKEKEEENATAQVRFWGFSRCSRILECALQWRCAVSCRPCDGTPAELTDAGLTDHERKGRAARGNLPHTAAWLQRPCARLHF